MLDDGELLGRPRPNALRRRIRRRELGMIGLDLPQLLHELVVFRVGDFGRVENVVAVIVEIDALDQVSLVVAPSSCRQPRAAHRHACSLVGSCRNCRCLYRATYAQATPADTPSESWRTGATTSTTPRPQHEREPPGCRRWGPLPGLMPRGVLGRIRWLFLGFTLLNVIGMLPLLIWGSKAVPELRVAGGVACLALAVLWIYGYRRKRFPLNGVPLEFAALLVVIATVGHPEQALGLLFAAPTFAPCTGRSATWRRSCSPVSWPTWQAI